MHPLTVMTFNVRYDEPSDGRHAWPYRRDLVRGTIRAHDPDLLGLQEAMPAQWQDISSVLAGWLSFGGAPEESNPSDLPSGFVKASRFDLLESGRFWLSDTPFIEGSVSWPNDWGPRACSWARLRDRRASELTFACTHFDSNAGALLPSAEVLSRELDLIAGRTPVVLVGDFNCPAGSDAHRYLCGAGGYRDAWHDAGHRDEGIATFHGFSPASRIDGANENPRFANGPSNERIDWILIRGPLACTAAAIDPRHHDGLLPSDHYPVIAAIEWDS
jgi:endonuclease/exonuclease/phosphatase family metal-dependent hydrolase